MTYRGRPVTRPNDDSVIYKHPSLNPTSNVGGKVDTYNLTTSFITAPDWLEIFTCQLAVSGNFVQGTISGMFRETKLKPMNVDIAIINPAIPAPDITLFFRVKRSSGVPYNASNIISPWGTFALSLNDCIVEDLFMTTFFYFEKLERDADPNEEPPEQQEQPVG
jgi:hypothetical protein